MNHSVMRFQLLRLLVGFLGLGWCAAQVITFESGGLRYVTLTREGVTIMYAPMPAQVRDYLAIQVAVSNGSERTVVVRPEDFQYHLPDSDQVLQGLPAYVVVQTLLLKGNRKDVVELVTAYEMGLYGVIRFRSTNGYQRRRQAALAEVSSTQLKAAAAASAIVLVETELKPGESTDGVVFFPAPRGRVEGGYVTANVMGILFDFRENDLSSIKNLKER